MPVLQNSLLAMALCEQIFGSGSDADKQGPIEPALSVAPTTWYQIRNAVHLASRTSTAYCMQAGSSWRLHDLTC